MLTTEEALAEGGSGEGPGTEPDTSAAAPPAPRRHRVARVVGAVGRLMMTTGVVILLLVAYELWGTNLQTRKAQRELADEFAALEDSATTTEAPPETPSTSETTASTTPGTTAPPTTKPPAVAPTTPPPGLGDVVGAFRIPAIGRSSWYYVVEGTGTAQLKRGAAHYPGTPLPGQAGNAAVAGHRTTFGAPLHNVDKLENGDVVEFKTVQGVFRYEVFDIRIVDPSETSVLEDKGDDRLTLTACHPKFSARQRIIVAARLVGDPVPQLEGQEEAAEKVIAQSDHEAGAGTDSIDAFTSEPPLRFPGAWWGALCVALWALTRVLAHVGHRTGRYPRFLAYLIGTPICLLVLYLFFESFSFEGFARTVGLSV